MTGWSSLYIDGSDPMKATDCYIAIGVLSLAVLVCGCSDLGTTPYGELTEENYTAGEAALPRVVAPVYEPLRGWMECCVSYVGMQASAGDIYLRALTGRISLPVGYYDSYHKHQWGARDLYSSIWWDALYEGIDTANRVLYQIRSGKPPVAAHVRRTALAEARVARAFYYFLLMDNFGPVPIDTVRTPARPLPSKNSRKAVYSFVVEELTTQIRHLPEAADLSTYGRFNKWAAKTLLADVYLNAGVYTGTPRWKGVIDVTGDIMDAGRYQLALDYRSNFSRGNERSEEIIFAVPYDAAEPGRNTFHMGSVTPEIQEAVGMAVSPWGGGRAQPQFARSYDEDDRRLEDTWLRGLVRGPQGDSLTYYTVDIDGLTHVPLHQGWRTKKYEVYGGLGYKSDVDFPVYRYADVLMMRAEVLLRTGRAEEAADLVTRVRERAFDDPSDARVTGAELREGSTINYGYWKDGVVVDPEGGVDIRYGRFLDELGWEFAMEGHRRQDLIRFKTASGTSVYSAKSWFKKRASMSRPCETVFPIPKSVVRENSKVRQHECYR